MRISNFSSMCHFFFISRGRARHFHLIALGLRPNSFEDQNQTDLIFLLARFFIWLSRSKQKNPVIKNVSSFLKQYKKVAEPLSLEYD